MRSDAELPLCTKLGFCHYASLHSVHHGWLLLCPSRSLSPSPQLAPPTLIPCPSMGAWPCACIPCSWELTPFRMPYAHILHPLLGSLALPAF